MRILSTGVQSVSKYLCSKKLFRCATWSSCPPIVGCHVVENDLKKGKACARFCPPLIAFRT